MPGTIDTQQAEKRISRKESQKFKGKRIYHSDIVRTRGDVQSRRINTINPSDVSSVDGGRASVVAENPAYKVYVLYMPPQSSTGEKRTVTGNKTVIVNSGLVFFSKEFKKKSTSSQIPMGGILNIKKNHKVALSTGHTDAELLIIESADYKEKVITESVNNITGLEQYSESRHPGKDLSQLRKRRPKTAEEKAAFGLSLQVAQGVMAGGDKRALQKDIGRGKLAETDASQSVVGINPQPIGHIGDDYLSE